MIRISVLTLALALAPAAWVTAEETPPAKASRSTAHALTGYVYDVSPETRTFRIGSAWFQAPKSVESFDVLASGASVSVFWDVAEGGFNQVEVLDIRDLDDE